MTERYLGCVPIEIDTKESNEVYFEERHAAYIREPGIGGILKAVYEINAKEHMPLSLFVELTSYCNFTCPFCYINAQDYRHMQLPRFAQMKAVLDYLIDSGLLYCTITGGECLLHPDFPEIYRYLKKSGVLVTVFTNGYMLNDMLFDLFQEYKPFKIEISIYGHDDESYQKATQVQNVHADRVFANVLRLKEMGLNVICKTPVTKLTQQSVEHIRMWCERYDIIYYTGTELMDTYARTSRKEYQASDAVIEEFQKESNRRFFASEDMMQIGYSEKMRRICFDCTAGRTDYMIDSHGMLMPCMKAAWVDEWKFDIRKLGIADAYRKMVEKICSEKGKPLKYCAGCEHHQVCQECFMTQYEHDNLKAHRWDYCKALKDFMENKVY